MYSYTLLRARKTFFAALVTSPATTDTFHVLLLTLPIEMRFETCTDTATTATHVFFYKLDNFLFARDIIKHHLFLSIDHMATPFIHIERYGKKNLI